MNEFFEKARSSFIDFLSNPLPQNKEICLKLLFNEFVFSLFVLVFCCHGYRSPMSAPFCFITTLQGEERTRSIRHMLQRNFVLSELDDVIKLNRLKNQMKTTHSFYRKRPHLLPPLPKLQPSTFRPMDPLQPPDLLLTDSRLGSPAPKPTDPREFECLDNTNDNGKPTIKVFEACPKDSEKCSLQLDLLSHAILNEDNYFNQRKNSNVSEFVSINSNRENDKNLSRKQSGYLNEDLRKKLRSGVVLPLKDLKTDPDPLIFSIPNRYTPLKPISRDRIENKKSD